MRCSCSNFQAVHEFLSIYEFKNLSELIERKIADNEIEEVPISKRYCELQMIKEREFLCVTCGNRWHLIVPSFPYPGGFMLVEDFEKEILGLKINTKSEKKFLALEKLLREEKDK